MGSYNTKEPFNPSSMKCPKHYEYVTTIDLEPQASRRLYCDACVLETKTLNSTISINNILLPSALQEFSQKIRKTTDELQGPILSFIKEQLNHQISSSIELLLQAKTRIEKNLLGILDHDSNLQQLETLFNEFMKNESIREGDRLNLYVNLYTATLKKHERITILKDVLPQQLTELQNYLNCTRQLIGEFCEHLITYPQEDSRTAPLDDLVIFYRQLLEESVKNEAEPVTSLPQQHQRHREISDSELGNPDKAENMEPNVRYEKGLIKATSAQKSTRERRDSRSKERRGHESAKKCSDKLLAAAESNYLESPFVLFKAEVWNELLAKHPHSSKNELEKMIASLWNEEYNADLREQYKQMHKSRVISSISRNKIKPRLL